MLFGSSLSRAEDILNNDNPEFFRDDLFPNRSSENGGHCQGFIQEHEMIDYDDDDEVTEAM